jgi:ABC-type protease/lipase transport system fused ATPase/permease subunit
VLRHTFYSLRYIVFFSVLFSLVYGLLRLAGPLFMILIFDRVLPSRSEATLVALLLLLVIILAVMTLLDYSRRRILARFGAQFQERIEDYIFSATARDAYFGRAGSKPAAGLNEVDRLRAFFHSGSLVSILDFLWSPVFLAVVFVISAWIGWIVVAGLALLVLIMTISVALAKGRDERFSEAGDKIDDLKDTLLVSRDVIESQNMMAAYNKRWVLARRRSRDAAVEVKDWSAWFSILSSHTANLIQYVALAAGAYLTIKGELTIGAMVASMYLARFALHPMERFLKQIPSIREAIANWRSLDRTLKAARASTAALEDVAILRLSQVTVRSPITKNKILSNLNIEVSPGSAIEIVGRTGSGKTVFAEMLIGRLRRAGGNVLLGTIDVERLAITDAAKTFGYVPQRVDFVSGSIAENIVGLDIEQDKDRLVHAARIAGVHEKILSLPEGYLTRIDPLGSIFSKAERHQLALARALYPDPKLLILDEPDGTFREAVARSLKSHVEDFLARGGILIILTRLPLKGYEPTRRFILDDGVLSEVKFERTADKKVVRLKNGGKEDAGLPLGDQFKPAM